MEEVSYQRVLLGRSLRKATEWIVSRPLLFFLFVSLLLNLEYYIMGPFSVAPVGDSLGLRIPQTLSLWDSFSKYGMTSWWPDVGFGYDGVANNQKFFHLLHLPYKYFPAWLAFAELSIIETFIAGYFTFKLATDMLKINYVSSLCAGMLCSLLGTGAGLGISGLPFFLWVFEKIINTCSGWRCIIYIFLIGTLFSFGASFMWSMPYFIVLAFIWFITVRNIHSLEVLFFFIVFVLGVVFWQLLDLWAFLLNGPISHRVDRDFLKPYYGGGGITGYFMQFYWYNMNRWIFYWLPLLGLFACWKSKEFRFVFIVLLFLIFLPPAWFPISGAFKEYIGVFKSVNLQYFNKFVPFFMAIAAAYTLHSVKANTTTIAISTTGSSHKFSVFILPLVLFAGCFLWIASERKIQSVETWFKSGNYVANFQSQDLKKLAKETSLSPFRIATVNRPGKRYLEVNYPMAYGLETADGYLTMHTKRFHAFWGEIIKHALGKDVYLYNKYFDWGNRAELFVPFSHPEVQPIPFSKYFNLNLLSLANTCYIVSSLPITDRQLELLPDLVISERKQWQHMSIKEKIKTRLGENFNGRAVYIYHNKTCLPRFFIADTIKHFNNTPSLLEELSKSDLETLRHTVFVQGNVLTDKDIQPGQSEISIREYQPDKIRLHITTTESGLLVMTSNYSPFWEVIVNGNPQNIIPAYFTFMAVYVPVGENEIEFRYSPPYRIFSDNKLF